MFAFSRSTLAVTLSLCTLSAHGNMLEDRFPIVEQVQLSDGSTVTIPFHISGNLTTALLAVINTKHAAQFIDHNDFEPIEIMCDGKNTHQGIGVLYFQDIVTNPVGAYVETINTIGVKRKSAPPLELSCLAPYATKFEKMTYLLTAQQIMAQANTNNSSLGIPLDYAMYNQDLKLNNDRAIKAGIEIWGYPKSKAQMNYRVDEHYVDLQVRDLPSYTPVVEFSYLRKIGTQTPLHSEGDNVLPQKLNPSSNTQAQLKGILTSDKGWIQPFVGYFWAGLSTSKTSLALRKTQFEPVAVVEYTQVKGVALPLYTQ